MFRTYQGSFAGGEISPVLRGQNQFSKYSVAAEIIENMIVEPFGGVANRPGMRFLAQTKINEPVRLIKFEYSDAEQYLLEFGNFYVRVWKNNNIVVDKIDSQYTIDQVWDIKYCQSADYLFLCCPNVVPRMLIRDVNENWRFEPFKFRLGPFNARNSGIEKIKAALINPSDSGAVGSIVRLTADSPVFKDIHVNQLVRLRHYVPRRSVGDNIQAPSASDPDNEILDAGTILFDEFGEEFDGNVTLEVDGFWHGTIKVDIWEEGSSPSNTNRNHSFPISNTVKESTIGRPKNKSMYVGWFDDVNKKGKIKVTVSSAVTIIGKEDNQFRVSISSPSNSMHYQFPDLPMKKIDKTRTESANTVLMNWTTVKGEWSFTTTGVWKGALSLLRSIDNGATYIVVAEKGSEYNAQANFAGAEIDDGVMYKLVVKEDIVLTKEGFHSLDWRFSYGDIVEVGIAEVKSIETVYSVLAEVQQQFGAFDVFTAEWSFGEWYDGNYPSVVTLYQDRLIFANSRLKPQTVWASRVGDYNNFGSSYPVVDDDAIDVTLAGNAVSQIRSMLPIADLMLMTNSTEFVMRGNPVFSPLSVEVRPQGFRGSSFVDPVIVGNTVVFVAKDGQTVRDFAYSLQSDGYDGQDRSILATHIFENTKIFDVEYQQEPWSVLWFLGNDGTLASFTYVKEHDVWGWARHVTDGLIFDICCVSNILYLVVLRDDYFSIEYFGPRDDVFLDSAVVYCGKPITKLDGLKHLVGREVAILANGFVFDMQFVAPDGSVDLSGPREGVERSYSRVVVGLPYTSTLKTLPVIVNNEQGSTVGLKKKVTAITTLINNSRVFQVGDSSDRLTLCDKRDVNTPLGVADRTVSGHVYTVLNSQWGLDGSLFFVQSLPLPMEILGVEKNVEFGV